ncbi:MAG: UDP-N-acetylmuramoyl-L-alanyl-D-glutamate--2,6-diaminopimelate ligase [Candidatus Eisenbacteria sp.]|nr:UDP-N-acetylmuramoyl-L-alanyl-D-glutamate--2,6-diaminopimelate ligase [Candidatus Eisenbacteria bacterium]
MPLTDLAEGLPADLWWPAGSHATAREGWSAIEIGGLVLDSRRVAPGDLFVAIVGRRHDGKAFVGEAWRRGAAAVMIEGDGQVPPGPGPVLRVCSARRALGLLAAIFHGEPAAALCLTGITGTDGKTSTALFLHQLLLAAGRPAVALGTLGICDEHGEWHPWTGPPAASAGGQPGVIAPAGEPARSWQPTTPEAPLFQATLAALRDRGVTDVVAEVSSHALDQERLFGTQFSVVALTHVSSDHLDFHGDREAYRAAKAKLFDRATRGGCLERREVRAVVNLDDALGGELAGRLGESALTYGRHPEARVRLERAASGTAGISLTVSFAGETAVLQTTVAGEFHVANLLAAAAIAHALGVAPQTIAAATPHLAAIPGRFELIREGQAFAVVVDYAHTVDGLEHLLAAARGLGAGRLVVVFGCGGDRDRRKREPMGKAAGRLADRVIITSDNPRSEPAAEIARAVAQGLAATGTPGEIELDRRAAFTRALQGLQAGDVMVAAGRGAETLQVFADRVERFDDREVLRSLLARHPSVASGASAGGEAPPARGRG